jgi:hypothetical protein
MVSWVAAVISCAAVILAHAYPWHDFLKAWPEMQGLAQQRTPDILAVERSLVTRKREATSNFHKYFLYSSAP